MAHLSIRIPDDLFNRLNAEVAKTKGSTPSAVIRRCLNAMLPPLGLSVGELAKSIDRDGLLQVRILDAREGQLLVEPGDGGEGIFESVVQIWVPSPTVTFPDVKTIQTIPAPLLTPLATPPELRLNLMAIGLASPSICGICKQSFPTKAERKRHRRKEHPTPEEIAEDARSTPPPTCEASEEPKP